MDFEEWIYSKYSDYSARQIIKHYNGLVRAVGPVDNFDEEEIRAKFWDRPRNMRHNYLAAFRKYMDYLAQMQDNDFISFSEWLEERYKDSTVRGVLYDLSVLTRKLDKPISHYSDEEIRAIFWQNSKPSRSGHLRAYRKYMEYLEAVHGF